MKLSKIAEKYVSQAHTDSHGDKLSHHSYIPVYERLFAEHRSRGSVRLLEIGVAAGLSMQMWREWLGESAIVTGVDCSDAWISDELRRKFEIIIGHSNVPSCRAAVEAAGRRFDIIIDDGNHDPSIQLATFWNLSPLLASGGIYVIEDILNIDAWGHEFEMLGEAVEVFDLRHQKGRGDDVLVVIRNNKS